jgi:hypothetical protein
MERWSWLVRYAVAAVLALLLATILGGSQLFQNARVAPAGPSAADLIRFFGEGTALLLLWLAADRAARSVPEDGRERSLVRHALPPLATLVVLVLAYPVPLLLVGRVLTEPSLMVYRWLFVLGISAAAIWLVWTVSRDAEALGPALARLRARLRERAARRAAAAPEPRVTSPEPRAVGGKRPVKCEECGERLPPGSPRCLNCGRQAAA